MATTKQIAANRKNAEKSTGPRTEDGKSASRLNALKHGIDADAETLGVEFPEELQQLTDEYYSQFHPVGLPERLLVDLLVRKQWLINRQSYILANLTDHGSAHSTDSDPDEPFRTGAGYVLNLQSHHRLHRHMMDTERAYFRHLQELEQRQATRRRCQEEHPELVAACVTPSSKTENHEIGFVSQNIPSQSPAPTPISAIGQNQPAEIYCDLRVERPNYRPWLK